MTQVNHYTNQIPKLNLNYIKQQYISGQEIALRLLQRKLAGAYRQSWLGFTWMIISPFTTVATFVVLNVSGVVILKDIPVPYPIFGLLSVSLWHLFYQSFIQVTDAFLASGGLALKVKFPKEAIIVATVGEVIVDFLIKSTLVGVTFLLYLTAPSIYIILSPLLFLPLILFGTGLGMIASILNIIVRDIRRFLSIGLGFFLYLMPIMYIQPSGSLLWSLNRYNPLLYLITGPRELILQGNLSSPIGYLASSTLAIITFYIGWLFFVRTNDRVIERF